MKKYIITITSALLLLSCNDSKKVNRSWQAEEESDTTEVVTTEDSKKEAPEVIEDTIIVGDFNNSPRRPASSTSVRPQRRANDDNMRGFDPASEDDMDDNGMTRYMENYDEEGWE